MELFCIDENAESSKKISHYIDFVDQLENVIIIHYLLSKIAKIKENL